MFTRISHRIALQFTLFVFFLLLLNGAVFLAVDLGNAQRRSSMRLEGPVGQAVQQFASGMEVPPPELPPMMRDRMRIVNERGEVIFGGEVFTGMPFKAAKGVSRVEVQEEEYLVLTMPVEREGHLIGYVQFAGPERFPRGDLPVRILMFLCVSIIISALTYVVGLAFARRSLKPAKETMERLEQFTQDASHELRTPLAALSSSLDLALKNEKHREGILSAKEDLKKAVSLVDRLLELARLDRFVIETETIDFSGLIEDAVQRHRPLAAEKKVAIEASIEAGVSVEGDAALLTQIIGNLLSNAIKFSKPKGGAIHVTLSKHVLTVNDAGIGIAKSALPHIFDRFYQAEPSRANGGIGLGLALVKRIVELHGWTIDVESEEGKGTTFTVRFASHA